MAQPISKEAYKDLENIVGENNVSDDPGILQTYTYMNGLAQGTFGTQWSIKPVCVILPETREEVQDIVKACNKHKLKLKPHSTAWWIYALATCQNTVILDLRRMNDLEINAEDGYFISESYIPSGVSQVEAMKKGFMPHPHGAGPNASGFASGTSFQGTGGTTVRTSMNDRNMLAVEWITPSGDLLKLGSINNPNSGWFCGDGPGPSLRGMMRGAIGHQGMNGVFTRAAMKLYPWYGPAYKCKGEPPFFDSEEIPNSYLCFVTWETPKDEGEGLYKLGEEEIIDYNNRWAAGAFVSGLSTSNQEYLEMEKEGKAKKVFTNGFWTFFMHAPSERGIEFRMKVFKKIVKETGGKIHDPMDFGKRALELATQNAIRNQFIAKSAYMPTSANTGSLPMAYETIDQCFNEALEISLEAKKESIEKDRIFNEGLDNCYACMDEDGHYIHIEHACLTEMWEPESEPAGAAGKGFSRGLAKGIGPMYCSMPGTPKSLIEYFIYETKIQRLIDPDRAADNLFLNGMIGILP